MSTMSVIWLADSCRPTGTNMRHSINFTTISFWFSQHWHHTTHGAYCLFAHLKREICQWQQKTWKLSTQSFLPSCLVVSSWQGQGQSSLFLPLFSYCTRCESGPSDLLSPLSCNTAHIRHVAVLCINIHMQPDYGGVAMVMGVDNTGAQQAWFT